MASGTIDHETGDLSQYNTTVTDSGDLSADAAAAKEGSYGLQAVLDDNATIYGKVSFANKSQLRIGFWFNPNGYSTEDTMIIAGGGSAIGDDDWRIHFEWDTVNLNVFASATNDASGWDSTNPVNISDDWHWIEAHFSRSTGAGNDDGFVKLWVDTVDASPDVDLTGRDDDTKDLDNVCIGAGSVASSISETLYFDYLCYNDDGTEIGPPASPGGAMPMAQDHYTRRRS
jgi:hypothetical protein